MEWGEIDRQFPSGTGVGTKTGYKGEKKRITNAPPWRYNTTFPSFRAFSYVGDYLVPSFRIQCAVIAVDLILALSACSATVPTTFNSAIHTNLALSDSNSFCRTSNER